MKILRTISATKIRTMQRDAHTATLHARNDKKIVGGRMALAFFKAGVINVKGKLVR